MVLCGGGYDYIRIDKRQNHATIGGCVQLSVWRRSTPSASWLLRSEITHLERRGGVGLCPFSRKGRCAEEFLVGVFLVDVDAVEVVLA